MIAFRSLMHRYPGTPALSFADARLESGENLLLLGDSGSGKTTLLHMLGGLLRPARGAVFIGDFSLYAHSESKLDRFRGRHIGIVFQQPHLIRSLNVHDNLALAQELAGKKTDKKRIGEVLGMLGLHSKKKSRMYELSQGQAQRVAIARAVINSPAVLLADEPTSSLDDRNAEAVTALLLEVAAGNGASLIVATHDRRIIPHIGKQYLIPCKASA